MHSISFKHSSIIKVLITLITILTTFILFLNGANSLLIILIIGSCIILLIKSNPIVKYISISIFWLKSMILFYLYTNGNFYIFPDSYNYIRILNELVKLDNFDFQLVTETAQTLHVGFYYIYLFIYKLFGTELSILLTNTLFTTLSAILVYKILKERFTHKIAFITFILFNLSANMFLFGSFILKDPIVMFLIALSLFLYLNKNRMFSAILVALFLTSVRIYAGGAIILAIVCDYLIFSSISKRKKISVLCALALLSIVIINLPIAQSYLELIASFLGDTSILSLLMIIPTTIVKFFVAPLPWNIINSLEVYRFLILDSILMLLLSFGLVMFSVKWVKSKELRNKYYIFLIPILVHALALGIEYSGDSTRQRSGIFVFLILTFAIGLFYKEKNTKSK